MINVPRNAALPVPVLQAIGLIGWALCSLSALPASAFRHCTAGADMCT
jgi:hypothetical protein